MFELSLHRSRRGGRPSPTARAPAVVRWLGQDAELEARVLCASGVTAALSAFGAQAWNAPTSYRGYMIAPSTFTEPASRADALNDLRAQNVNVVRWPLHVVGGRPVLDQVTEAAAQVAAVTPDFRRAGIGIVLLVGPLLDGGVAFQSELGRSVSARAAFVEAWRMLATRFRNDTAVIAYDVLNEPTVAVATWNTLASQTIRAIRAVDTFKPIVLEPIGGNPRYLARLPIFPARDKVIYSFHMYTPLSYTHQGIVNPPLPRRALTQAVINAATQEMDNVRAWQRQNHVRVYVGEFSVHRNAPGATDYLNLCMARFERYGWDWTYHAYREFEAWDLRYGDPGGLAAVRQRLAGNNRGPTFVIDATVAAGDLRAMNSWTFYPQHYLAQYPDLRRAFGTDLARATQHWFANGIHEGRSPNPFFSAPAYLNRYADLRAAFGSSSALAAEHWLTCGIQEGRIGV